MKPICSMQGTDRQTDMTKLTVAFHNFANAPIKLIAAKVASKFHHISTPALDYVSISYIFRLSKVLWERTFRSLPRVFMNSAKCITKLAPSSASHVSLPCYLVDYNTHCNTFLLPLCVPSNTIFSPFRVPLQGTPKKTSVLARRRRNPVFALNEVNSKFVVQLLRNTGYTFIILENATWQTQTSFDLCD